LQEGATHHLVHVISLHASLVVVALLGGLDDV
jgi:hypothetical protein